MIHSNSDLSNADKCLRMATHKRVHRPQAGIRALMGTCAHDAFERHHRAGVDLIESLDKSLALPSFGDEYYSDTPNTIGVEDAIEIRGWLTNWGYHLPQDATIVECEVRSVFEAYGVKFSVKKDLVYKENDEYVLRDYKSGFSLYDTDNSTQLKLYGYDVATEHFLDGITVEHALITSNKVQRTHFTMQQMEEAVYELALIAKRVEADPNSTLETAGGHCDWCPLRSDCETYKASLELSDMPAIDSPEFGPYLKHVKGLAKSFDRTQKAASSKLKAHCKGNGTVEHAGYKIVKGSRTYYDIEAVLLKLGAPDEFASQFRGVQISSLGGISDIAKNKGIDLKGCGRKTHFDKMMELK